MNAEKSMEWLKIRNNPDICFRQSIYKYIDNHQPLKQAVLRKAVFNVELRHSEEPSIEGMRN